MSCLLFAAATPDERASLLAYRTAVIFPVKVSEIPSFPGHSVGAAAAAAGSGTAASAEPRVDPQTAEFGSSSTKPADEAVEGSSSYSSSSSSSDSESDSDSDSDDELSQAKTHISEPTIKHESGGGNVTSKLKDGPEESRGEYDRGSAGETPMPEVCSDGTQGAAAGAESGAPAGAEEPGNSPESLEVAESPAGPAVTAEDVSTTSPLAENSTDVPAGIKGSTSVGSPKTPAVEHGEAADGLGTEVPDSAGAEAADGAGAEAAEVLEGSSTPADADVKPTEAGVSEASSSTESSELMEAAPVRAESEGEELQPEGTHHTTFLHLSASTTEKTLFPNPADALTFLRVCF